MQSTRSSDSAPGDDSTRRPSRTAIAVLVLVSLAIPAAVLAVILARDADHSGPSSPSTPVTSGSPIDTHKAKVGSTAPDFTRKSAAGSTVTLSELRGHPVVLVFFASWCHPCEEELPVLEQFARDQPGGLRVVGVNFQDLASDSVAFVRRLGVTFPALLDDPSSPVAEQYGVRGIPQTIFIDANGVVRGRVYGETTRKGLEPAIDDLVNGKNIRPI